MITRRGFVRAGAADEAGVAGAASFWNAAGRWRKAVRDYRALVCVFLFGGNDSNNTIIPDG